MKKLILILVFAALNQAKPQYKLCNNKNKCNENNNCGNFPSFCKKSRYRSYDGSCNNLLNPQWGTPFLPYERFMNNSYFDGVHELPRSSTNEPLMNPRDISLMLFPDVIVKDPIWTVITLQWGQIVAHDMSFNAGSDEVQCCTNGEPVPADTTNIDPRCAPIPIPDDDPYNAPEGNTCIDFLRTLSSKDKKCSLPGNKEEPLSEVTSFLDLSMVYGNSKEQENKVRAFKRGKLAFVLRKGQQWLPQDPNVTLTCDKAKNAQEPCYMAGDKRVNQNPQLAVLQTALMREHNRIAKKLNFINPLWNDEKCFQETRRILIAMAQHITYYEFIPIILGKKNVIEKGLNSHPGHNGFVNDYDPHVNPQILNEHATAAYRYFHTQIVGQLKLYTENRMASNLYTPLYQSEVKSQTRQSTRYNEQLYTGLYSENRYFTGKLRLSDYFDRPSIIEEGSNMCGLTLGLSTQLENGVDRYHDVEITQYFDRELDKKLGKDLRAIDIQRARDHGIAFYTVALKTCGLGDPKSFEDLEKYIKPKFVKLLKQIYENMEDVELSVAGSLESHVEGALAGPTFLCIMLEQFHRTRTGDRYFYENGDTNGAFTLPQLKSIRKTSMSRLLCDNVKDVKSMQPYAFEKISYKNPLAKCYMLPQVDLMLWRQY